MAEEGLAQTGDQASMGGTVGPAPEAPQAVAPEVEPLVDFDSFANMAALRIAERAALRSWMQRQQPPLRKVQTLARWRELQQQVLAHH